MAAARWQRRFGLRLADGDAPSGQPLESTAAPSRSGHGSHHQICNQTNPKHDFSPPSLRLKTDSGWKDS